MEEKKTGGVRNWLVIAALCVLIALLVFGVNRVFTYLAVRFPHSEVQETAVSTSASGSLQGSDSAHTGSGTAGAGETVDEEAPSFCPNCGRALHEGFQWGQYCPYCGAQVT